MLIFYPQQVSNAMPNSSVSVSHGPGGFYQTIAPTPMPPHTSQHAVVSSASPPTTYYSQPTSNYSQPPVYHQGMSHSNYPAANYPAGYFVPLNTYYPPFGFQVY